MIDSIFSALLEKHALGEDNIITAKYTIRDLFGRTFDRMSEFRISTVRQDQNNLMFQLISLSENQRVHVGPESIMLIDGMEPARYADIYDLLPDGSTKKVGKKRGRKPKNHMAF